MDDGRMCCTSLEMPNIHSAINQLIKQADVTTVSIPRVFVHVSGWTNIKQARYISLTLFWVILRTSMYIQAFKLIISECDSCSASIYGSRGGFNALFGRKSL